MILQLLSLFAQVVVVHLKQKSKILRTERFVQIVIAYTRVETNAHTVAMILDPISTNGYYQKNQPIIQKNINFL